MLKNSPGYFDALRTNGGDFEIIEKIPFVLSPLSWRAYDVVVEGISLVNNYRAQFDRFLSKKSFDELLQELSDKKKKFSLAER